MKKTKRSMKILKKVVELEKRVSGKVWAKLSCGHSRILDGNILNKSELSCLVCEKLWTRVNIEKAESLSWI